MEAVIASETSAKFCETTRHNMAKESQVQEKLNLNKWELKTEIA
jgi:hypothetical protein